MIVCPKKYTVTPCEIAVFDNCRIGPLAGAPPLVISTETESGFITEDDTSQSVTLQVARRQKSVDTAYDVGSVVNVGSSSQLRSVVSLWFLLMALDIWKEVSGVESMLATLLVPKWPLF
ncbi:hypothetical protein TNCV_1128081 [Trichonephila clavipes]|nr:hypothetical protein TNCV_1128081 [Trichonephila clavipes]